MLWWMSVLGCRGPVPPAEPEAAPCESCHAAEVAAWTGSHHALAEAPLTEEDAWARALGGVRRIGVDPLVQTLVPTDGGRLQAHQLAWDPAARETFDIFGDGRGDGEWGHWTGGGMTWNSRCATCHNTRVDKGYADGEYRTDVAAMGVTCEACHGESEAHASGGPAPENARMEDTCLACHSRRAELTGAFRPGDSYLDHFAPTLVDDPVFRADGRGLDEVFASNFTASRMHAGGVRCGDCHDPHSGLLRAEGDALCRRCHDALGPPLEHSGHTDVGCVDCHMPFTTVMDRHGRRDHGFSTPRAGLEPDPCAGCHEAHPATGAPDPSVAAFVSARTGKGWRDLPLHSPVPIGRRAAWLASLGAYPDARGVLREALASDHPWIRYAAATALVPEDRADIDALQRAATDPVGAVRVGAQRALASAGSPPGVEYLKALDHNADDPAMAAERGLIRIRNHDPRGLADLERAVSMDAHSADLVVLLAMGLTEVGRAEQARDRLAGSQSRFPEHAALQEAAGLAYAATGQSEQAIEALKQAVTLEPERGRAWRNLALLHHANGESPARDRALEHAIALLPEDTELIAWAAALSR